MGRNDHDPRLGLYGTSYIPAYGAIQPRNPHASYLQAEGALDSLKPELVFSHVLERLEASALLRRPVEPVRSSGE